MPESGKYTYYPGTSARCPRRPPRTRSTSRTGSSPRSTSRRRPGSDRRPGLALRRVLAVRPRREADLRLQLPRHPAGAEDRRRRAVVRTHIVGSRVHEGAAWASTTRRTGRCACTSTTRSSRRREMRTIASRFSLCGEGLCIGYDGGDAVSAEYTPRFEFTGGTIVKVVFDVGDDRLCRRRGPHGRGDGARLTTAGDARAATSRDARAVAGGKGGSSGGSRPWPASWSACARGRRRTARCAARSRASARASGCCSSAGR